MLTVHLHTRLAAISNIQYGIQTFSRRQYCRNKRSICGYRRKFTQNVGRAVGAAGIGGLAYGAVKGLQKCNAAGVLKNVKPGKVGLIAAGIGLVTAALSYISGKSST